MDIRILKCSRLSFISLDSHIWNVIFKWVMVICYHSSAPKFLFDICIFLSISSFLYLLKWQTEQRKMSKYLCNINKSILWMINLQQLITCNLSPYFIISWVISENWKRANDSDCYNRCVTCNVDRLEYPTFPIYYFGKKGVPLRNFLYGNR